MTRKLLTCLLLCLLLLSACLPPPPTALNTPIGPTPTPVVVDRAATQTAVADSVIAYATQTQVAAATVIAARPVTATVTLTGTVAPTATVVSTATVVTTGTVTGTKSATTPTVVGTAAPTKASDATARATTRATARTTPQSTVSATRATPPRSTRVATTRPTATRGPTRKPTATRTPTRKPTATKAPTKRPTRKPTSQPPKTPEEPPTPVPQDVIIGSETSYTEGSSLFVVGEIINGHAFPVYGIRVIGTFYDESGDTVAAAEELAYLVQAEPTQRSPFKLQVENASNISEYELTLLWDDVAIIEFRDITVLSEEVNEEETAIVGELRNDWEEELTSMEIVATFYDEDGNVVDVYDNFLGGMTIGGGDTMEYSIEIPAELEYDSFDVQAQGNLNLF